MQHIKDEIRSHIACENCPEVYRFTMSDVKVAVHRLKPHKSDGGAAGLSSDFIINAGDDCFVHTVNFLLVMIELFSLGAFVLSQFMSLTDGHKHRQTDRRSSQDP